MEENLYENSRYIEQYLDGKLGTEARLAFEQRCERDPDFAEQVRLHLKAVAAERQHAYAVRKAAFNAEYDRLQASEEGPTRSLRPYRYLAVAGVVLALVLVWWNTREPRSSSLEGLVAMHEGDFGVPIQQSRQQATPGSELWMQAATAYEAGEYERATELLQALLADSLLAYQAEARFFLGMSYYQQGAPSQNAAPYAQALEAFEAVPAESAFRPKALWFSALIHLQQGDYIAARPALQAVTRFPGHYRRAEARSLLETLPEP